MTEKRNIPAPREAFIDTAALAMIVRSDAHAVILDARTGIYDDGRRIPGAMSLGSACGGEVAAAAIAPKNSLIITYCSNVQCPASSMLYARLRDLGYENCIEYMDGIDGWQAAGFPVEQVEAATRP